MRDFTAIFADGTFLGSALGILVLTVVALVLLSLAFAGYTVLLRIQHEGRERRWARLTAAWEEPLLNALVDPSTIPDMHAAVEPRSRLYFVRFILEHARRVSGEERAILEELAQPYLPPIAERTLSPDRETRTRAVQTLGTLGLPRYSAEVVAALDDPSPLVAMVAARALARKEHAEYTQAILRRLYRFETWSQRFMASMLAGMGMSGAPALRQTLGDPDEEPWVRAVAAEALAQLPDLAAADIAAQVVEIEENDVLIRAALRLLVEVGRPEHVPVVRVRCASPEPAVRSLALRALGTLGGEEDLPPLIGAMADPSPWVAMSAARGLLAGGADLLLADLAASDHPRATLARQVLEERRPV